MADQASGSRQRSVVLKLSAAIHLAGLAAVVFWPTRWPLIGLVVVADHLWLLWGSLWPRSRLLGPNVRSLPAAAAAAGGVALTFDDGPDPDVTPEVLRILKARGARATFFCVGREAERHRDVVEKIVHDGQRVENHSYAHSNAFCFFPPAAAARDLDRAQRSLTAAAGRAPRYFRAPAGLRSPWLAPILESRGLVLASWTRRGFDAVSRDPQAVVSRLCRGLAAGDVLVLHDGRPARTAAGRPVVLEVLPRLLDAIERRGLSTVVLPDPVTSGATAIAGEATARGAEQDPRAS